MREHVGDILPASCTPVIGKSNQIPEFPLKEGDVAVQVLVEFVLHTFFQGKFPFLGNKVQIDASIVAIYVEFIKERNCHSRSIFHPEVEIRNQLVRDSAPGIEKGSKGLTLLFIFHPQIGPEFVKEEKLVTERNVTD